MATKNPYVGHHPDLFHPAHRYPSGEAPPPFVERDATGSQTGNSPVFVNLDELTSEQIQALPRSAFTNNEWDELDDDDRDAIEDADEESQDRVDELAKIFIQRWEWAVEPDNNQSASEVVEYGFEQWLASHADDLWDHMPDRRYRELANRGAELGMSEAEVRQIINEVMADNNNYDYSFNDTSSSIYSEEVYGSVYIEYNDWVNELSACFPDEVERAIKKINKETGLHVDKSDLIPKSGKERYFAYEQNDISTDTHATVNADWSKIQSECEEKIDEYELPDDRDPTNAEPPEERVTHRWPDGFYVQNLLPSELPAEGKQQGICVGRADMGYGKAVRNGEIWIHSLRRPSGKPLFTIEVLRSGDDIEGIEQVKGKANRKPGFDLGKDSRVYNQFDRDAREEVIKNFKRDEVQRVLEYLLELGLAPLDIEDMRPAMFTIDELRVRGDKWAIDMAAKVPGFGPIGGAEPKENPGGASCEHGESCTGFCRPYRPRARRNPARPTFKFLGTEEALEAIDGAEPEYGYLPDEPSTDRWDDDDFHRARRVTWVGTAGYLVKVPSKNILFMEGNQWYPSHGAAILEGIRNGERTTLQAPAGRVYRVTAKDVKQTERYERDGELEYQVSMSEPWRKEEQGEYWAQLLDGNHRAAAAILAGEPYIYVYVGENYRENVRKKDFE